MTGYKFYFPIQLRFSDFDVLWHVNNARYLTYLEAARFAYYQRLGLFSGQDFNEIEMVVADIHISFRVPILLGQRIHVGMRVTRIGNKSMDMDAVIQDQDSSATMASSKTVLVGFDFKNNRTQPISERWRQAISAFEGISPGPDPA